MKEMLMELIELNEMLLLFDSESEYADPMEYLVIWQRFEILMKEINECTEVKEVLQIVYEVLEIQEQMCDCLDPMEYIDLWERLTLLQNELNKKLK